MDKMIAYCGLNCGECEGFIATRNNDEELRRKVAAKWSEQYHHPLKPEEIHCVGCTQLEGAHINYCALCEIRACGIKHKISTCAACPQYGCERLVNFWAVAPAAKVNLEEIRNRK